MARTLKECTSGELGTAQIHLMLAPTLEMDSGGAVLHHAKASSNASGLLERSTVLIVVRRNLKCRSR